MSYLNFSQGIDLSIYQSQTQVIPNIDPDFEQIARLNDFAIIRAGQDYWADSKYKTNWKNSAGALYRGSYWFYGNRYNLGRSPESQGAAYLAVTGGDFGNLPPVMDFETSPFPDRTTALDLMFRFKKMVGSEKMILYLNESSLKILHPFPDWLLTDWYLWIAAPAFTQNIDGSWRQVKNPSEITSIYEPETYGWEWLLWQYSWKLDGLLHGVQSLDLDGNLFNGTPEQLSEFISGDLPIILPPDPEEKLNRYKDFPQGRGVDKNNTSPVNMKDFAVVTVGSVEEIDLNEYANLHLNWAKEQEIPVIAVYKPSPELYVNRSEGLNHESWDPDTDPAVSCDLPNKYRYNLDRLLKGKYIHGLMLDVRNIYEDKKIIDPSWLVAVWKYYVNLSGSRYDIPAWYIFIDESTLNKIKAEPKGQEVVDFIFGAGSNACVKFVDQDENGIPADDTKPFFVAEKVDNWFYGFDSESKTSKWINTAGSLQDLYQQLGFTYNGNPDDPDPEDPEDPETPEEPTPDDPEVPVIDSSTLNKFLHACMIGAKAAAEEYFKE